MVLGRGWLFGVAQCGMYLGVGMNEMEAGRWVGGCYRFDMVMHHGYPLQRLNGLMD